jgi:hypothetical protein
MSKSKQVLELTNKGLTAGDIAKKLKTSAAYVYFVRHAAKKKKKQTVNAVTELKKALDAVELKRPKHRLQATEIDLVNRPPHYTKGGIDFLDYAEAKGLTENAYLFNVVKYISRAGKKLGVDPVQDLEKAEFYLKREIARRKSA